MSPIHTAMSASMMVVALFVIVLVVGCALLGSALSKGHRSPLAVVVVAVVLLLVLMTSSVHYESANFQAVGAKVPAVPAPAAEPGQPPAAKTKAAVPAENRYPSFQVETDWLVSENRALEEALAETRANLIDYLRNQQPPIEWTPSEAYLRDVFTEKAFASRLLKDGRTGSTTEAMGRRPKMEEQKLQNGEGSKYRYVGTFEVTPTLRADIQRHDREFRVQQRMFWLARALVGIVAALAVVAVYLRMDEATKGYYTGWLRVAAVGFLGGTALVLLMV